MADTVDLRSTALMGMGVRVPPGLPDLVIMKTAKTTERNPYALPAKHRKAGKMRPKKSKRSTGKNKQREILKEAEDK